jgi:Holliday junction resolvase-like predicted endonuclease
MVDILVAFLVALFLSVGGARSQVPSLARAFFEMPDENFAQACQAALLLTPEQTEILQKTWPSRWREILLIGRSDSPSKEQEIKAVKERFRQERDEMLTSDQRDTILLIIDIYGSSYKTALAEYRDRIDAAFSEAEKKILVGELRKAARDLCVSELKGSLPADRRAMFESVLNEK